MNPLDFSNIISIIYPSSLLLLLYCSPFPTKAASHFSHGPLPSYHLYNSIALPRTSPCPPCNIIPSHFPDL